jgi:hypothetical protein
VRPCSVKGLGEGRPTKTRPREAPGKNAMNESNDSLPENKPDQAQSRPKSDPFDLDRLRLTQNFAESLGVKKVMLSLPIRKPDKTWWVRTHPSPKYQMQILILELKEEREIYLIDPDLRCELASESTVAPRLMVTAVNRQGVPFLWPVRLPGSDGKIDEWNRTAAEGADMATRRWVRIAANMSLGAYDLFTTEAKLPDPVWPEVSFQDLLRLAFKDRVIDSLEHPVVRRLRGEL